jgi:hypothetical protein
MSSRSDESGAASMRGRTLVAIGAAFALVASAVACGRAQTEARGEAWGDTTPTGFVMAPTSIAQVGDAGRIAAIAPSASPSGSRSERPLPPEPPVPPRSANCSKETTCREEEDEAPRIAFPPPFERCAETFGKASNAQFSVASTRAARRTDPTQCCYVEYRGCVRVGSAPARSAHY